MKNNFIERINNRFAGFAEWVIDHRLVVICTFLIFGIAGTVLFTRLRYNFDQLLFCPDDSPVTKYYQNFLKEYGNDEFLYILYRSKKGIFDLDTLRKTRQLVKDLKKVPYVKKVNSITNIEFMEGGKDGELRVYDFMEDFPSTQAEADQLKHKLLDKPLYVNVYISKKADYAAILCEIKDRPKEDSFYQRKIKAKLKEVLAKTDYKDFEFYPTGNPMLLAEFYDLQDENINLFSILTSILIATFLIFLFHQFKGVAGPFVVVPFAILGVIFFMYFYDVPVTLMFSMVPSLVLGIGIANAVHMISEYQIHLKAGCDNRQAILESVKLVGFPCLFTCITTAIGFGSLYTSSMSAIRGFGLSLSVGAMGVFITTFTLLLVFLSFAGEKTEKKFKKANAIKSHLLRERVLHGIASLNSKHYGKILIIAVFIGMVLVYGITRIEVNASWLMQFGDKIQLFQDFKFVDKTMGGTGNFEVLLDSKNADGTKTLQFVQTLQKIQEYSDSQGYMVKKTISIIDLMKDVNRSINDNDKTFHRLPSSEGDELQNVNEFVYELYGGDEVEKLVSADCRTGRLTIFVKSSDSVVYNRFYNELLKYIESVTPADYSYTITGLSYLSITTFRSMTGVMLKSLSLAIILISLMMIIIFRSFKIGLISMIPNIFPVLFALGFIGLVGIWLSHLTAVVGCVIIGLAVDDTIHFISRYRMEFERLGNYNKALEASMTGVGHALVITTIVLVFGFGVFMSSRMQNFYHAGMLTSLCFMVALLSDFFIAPALIILFKPFGEELDALPSESSESNNYLDEDPTVISSFT